ncbi:MAG: ATP-binding protein [Pseudomonadota bacterium]
MRDLPADLSEILDFDTDTMRVSSREGKHREFKQEFSKGHVAKYVKALAAFTNTDGGILIFGVTDAPRTIVGVDPAGIQDEAQWSDWLRRYFAPEIDFRIREYNVNALTVVAVGVDRGEDLPISCLRDSQTEKVVSGVSRAVPLTQKGAIYYRQAGQTRPMYHAELRKIIDERDQKRLNAYLQNLKIMSDVGPDRVGVVDMSRAATPNDEGTLYLSRQTAESLSFIDEGRFVETKDQGDPAYMVVGRVQLNEVVPGPLDPADKNLPTEVAEKLKPVAEEVFGFSMPLTGAHVAKLAKHLGIRGDGEADPQFCINDEKLKRIYYTQSGVDLMENEIRDNSRDALQSFASRETIARYQDAQDIDQLLG